MKAFTTLAVIIIATVALAPCPAQDMPAGMPETGPPAAGPQEGEGGGESYVKILLDSDSILMKDGTELKGTIVLIAEKKVIILTEEGEKLIDKESVEEISRGKDKDHPVTLMVRETDGFQFIVMEPVDEKQAEALRPAPEDKPVRRPKVEKPAKPKPDVKLRRDIRPDNPAEALRRLKPQEIRELMKKDGGLDELLKKIKKERTEKEKDNPPKRKK